MLIEQVLDRGQMRLPAVDQEQIRPLLLSLEPPLDHLAHHSKIVHCPVLHTVGSVLPLQRPTMSQDHGCTDPRLTLELGHVEADDVIQPGHPEQRRRLIGARCSRLPDCFRSSRSSCTSAF